MNFKRLRRAVTCLVVLCACRILFTASAFALSDSTTAKFIWSLISSKKYQPYSDRRLAVVYNFKVYDNEGATEISTTPQKLYIQVYNGSTLVQSKDHCTHTSWSSTDSFGSLSVTVWYKFNLKNGTQTAYISGPVKFQGGAHQ